ncbi:hypothetical protein H4R35_001273 [Dimargaris xerosporica]|nr:hypothetical protein H4R35_001273 [Dimargaris xerosporica]
MPETVTRPTALRQAVATNSIDDDAYAIINQNTQALLSLVSSQKIGSQLGASRKALTGHQSAALGDNEPLPMSYSLKLHRPAADDDTNAIFTRHIVKNRLRRFYSSLLFESSTANQDQQSVAFQSLELLEQLDN